MAKQSVIEESYGTPVKSPGLAKGSITTFGHTVREGQALPSRGVSVNQKTGYPVKGSK
jgi:hypothetical protein